jgi:hypothetical protein
MSETADLSHINIIVLGDVSSDTILYPAVETDNDYEGASRIRSRIQRSARYESMSRLGGCMLIGEIIEDYFSEKPNYKIISYKPNSTSLATPLGRSQWPESVTVLELFPKDKKGTQRVYRIEKTYGWVSGPGSGTVRTPADLLADLDGSGLKKHSNEDGIVIINDKGLGFNNLDHRSWLSRLDKDKATILLSMENLSTMKSKLWDMIIEDDKGFRDNTIVFVTAAALRSEGIWIRVMSSLEKTARDLAIHKNHEVLQRLMQTRHLIISFDNYSVLHWDRSKPTTAIFYFLPFLEGNIDIESMWLQPEQYGRMSGYRTIQLATFGIALACPDTKGTERFDKLREAITTSIVLTTQHFINGFAEEGFYNQLKDERSGYRPFEELVQRHFSKASTNVKLAATTLKLDSSPHWSRISVIRDQCGDQENFNKVLVNIVKKGLPKVSQESLEKNWVIPQSAEQQERSSSSESGIFIPYAAFGKLLTADEREIDSFLNVYLLMQKYLEDDAWKTPLSLAVFGPPGSGKSFTIKQIMKSAQMTETKEPLVYNLSQFTGIDDLTTAFHQVQDRALAEEVPLIIFDEFDCNIEGQSLGWLKYFLEPMQDGTFRAQRHSYRVGRAIFVFAGGVHETFDLFTGEKDGDNYKSSKLPDFISRLRGYLDITGIDTADDQRVSNELMFRRAVILRSLLEDKAKYIIHPEGKRANIDENLIMAFLKIPRYKHGTRSMEAIIQMSLQDKGRFIPSSLPTREQLEMHVNASEFLSLIGFAA